MNKKILLMGSDSYVGKSLNELFSNSNKTVTLFDKIISYDCKSIEDLQPDICNFDIIIYLIHEHTNNLDKNKFILSLLLNSISNKQKVIFISSSQVTEQNENNYTKVKTKLEELIKQKFENFFIIRPCLLVHKKIYQQKTKEQFLITLLTTIKKKRIAIMLNGGNFYLNIVSIEDLFNFINLIVSEDLKNDTVTLSNLKNIRFKEIVEFIKSEYNLYFIKITIYMWILKVLSKLFPKKVPSENIKALKLKEFNFGNDVEKYKYQLKKNNYDILKTLFDSI